jgi:hypothetical protein
VPTRRVDATVLGAALLAALASACAGPANPAPAPSVTAHVSGQSAPDVTVRDGVPALTRASDDDYEGLALTTADPSVISAAGRLTVADLADGDAVEVWLREDGACAESLPVQCDVLTVRVDG